MRSGRAERLEELGVLLAAGVDADRALAIVGIVGRCQALPQRLLEQGLLRPWELPMIELMFEVGRVDRGLRQLGSDLRREERLIGQIKGRLALPVAIWVMAILIAPLPALFGGDMGLTGYGWAVFRPLLLTTALLWLGFRHWRTLLDGLRELHLLAGRPPVLGQRLPFLRALRDLLAGGVDAEQALAALARGVSGEWRRRLDRARGEIRGGAGLVSVLARHGLLHRRHDVRLLSAGETAGRLVQAIDHRLVQLCEQRDLRMEVVAEWLPRGVYFLVLLHMVRGFL